MLEKKILAFLLISLLCFSAFAETDTDSTISKVDISKSFAVIVNSSVVALASSMNDPQIELPSTSLSYSNEDEIPSRISFLFTDVSTYYSSLNDLFGNENYLYRLFTGKSEIKASPLLYYFYLFLEKENYQKGQYFLCGNLYIYYNFDIPISDLYQDLATDEKLDGNIQIICNITVSGNGVQIPLNIRGSFKIEIPAAGTVKISPNGIFYINDKKYSSQPIIYQIN